jgi:hypothetical protein
MGNSVYTTAVAANGVLYVNNRRTLFAIQEGQSPNRSNRRRARRGSGSIYEYRRSMNFPPSTVTRREVLASGVSFGILAGAKPLLALCTAKLCRDDKPDFDAPLIHAPNDPAGWPAFREELTRWRAEERKRVGYDDALYRKPEFAWTQTCFACGFVMLFDETFYDRRDGRYRLDDFLDDAKHDFGGFDAIVLWQAYRGSA